MVQINVPVQVGGVMIYPGDLIPTGTPAGVSPIHHGDTVRVTVTGCGILENPVISRIKSI